MRVRVRVRVRVRGCLCRMVNNGVAPALNATCAHVGSFFVLVRVWVRVRVRASIEITFCVRLPYLIGT